MIRLKAHGTGYVAILKDTISQEELRVFRFQLLDERAGETSPFGLVIDTRKFQAFTADAQALMESTLEEFAKSFGLARISVLGVSTGFAALFCNMMVRAELMEVYQFLDLAYEEDWKTEMDAWLDMSQITA